jgi:hypothetical protein
MIAGIRSFLHLKPMEQTIKASTKIGVTSEKLLLRNLKITIERSYPKDRMVGK